MSEEQMDSLLNGIEKQNIKTEIKQIKSFNENKYIENYKCAIDTLNNSLQLEQLGLNYNLANRIVNMKSKGFKFKNIEDFQKVWGMDSVSYQRIKSNLVIQIHDSVTKTKKQFKPKTIELNTADSIELCSLKGIGPTLARRIVNYRNKLGGFYSKNQLLEVFGLQAQILDINPNISLNLELIKKVNLNDLLRKENYHPYMNRKNKIVIQAYINQHGPLKNCDSLKCLQVPEPDKLNQLCHYVLFP